jgi:hypothetical protein
MPSRVAACLPLQQQQCSSVPPNYGTGKQYFLSAPLQFHLAEPMRIHLWWTCSNDEFIFQFLCLIVATSWSQNPTNSLASDIVMRMLGTNIHIWGKCARFLFLDPEPCGSYFWGRILHTILKSNIETEFDLLGYIAVESVGSNLTFRRNTSLPPLELNRHLPNKNLL